MDPDTGEIIPTSGKRGRSPKDGSSRSAKDENVTLAEEKLKKLKMDYEELRLSNEKLLEENNRLRSVIEEINQVISGIQ